jgi:CrcB protein
VSRIRTLVGISVFWLGLSALGDSFSVLVVPVRLASLADPGSLATTIGLITFAGLLAGMLIQPLAGAISDALYPRIGRRGMLAVGAVLIVATLLAFGASGNIAGVFAAFVLVQIAASVAQAPQQALLPDLVTEGRRGVAAGLKGLADVGGAFVGFLVLGLLLATGDVAPALVFAGGAVGAPVRYLLDRWITDRRRAGVFPWGTLAVNLVGAFAIGLVQQAATEALVLGEDTRLLLSTGVMGGLTTYSAFSYETVRLLERGAWGAACLNVLLTTTACLILCYLGLVTGRVLLAPR